MLDPEAVLFVDDHRTEAGEVDGVLDQGMRSDDDVDRAVGQAGQNIPAVGTRHPVRQQLDAQRSITEQVVGIGDVHPGEQRPYARCVLVGEHLGRRHQGRLVPALHCGEHRGHGHDGLAGTHVALQQPVHRVRCGEVGLDLVDRAQLGTGERVRQRVVEAMDEISVDFVLEAALLALHRPLAQHQDQLHPEELVECETPARLLLVLDALGQMDVGECVEARQQSESVTDVIGQRVVDAALTTATQRLFDPPGHLPGVDLCLLALRVDRHDATGAITDEVDHGVRHLQPAPVHVGLAEQRDLEPFAQLPLTPGLVEEHHLHASRAVADVGGHHRAAIARGPLGHRSNRGEYQRLVARNEIGDARLVRSIDPSPGVEGEQIEEVVDVDACQRRALLVTNALQPADIDPGEVAQRQ